MIPPQILNAALGAHQQGNLAEAERLYRQLLAQVPDHVGAQHMLGVLCAQAGRSAEALDLLAKVVARTPQDALALSNYGMALWEARRFADALPVLDRAIAINRQNPDAFNTRGNVLTALDRGPEALADFDRALALRPLFATALKNKGDTLEHMGRSAEAIAAYDRAIAIDPKLAAAFLGKGMSLRAQARYQDALDAYDHALRLAPQDPVASNNRGVCLQNLGRFEEAQQAFDRAIALCPEMPEPHFNLATLFLTQEKFAEGFALLEWRKRMPGRPDNRHYDKPLWTGVEPLEGKTVFAYIEQGLGDAIMFYRFALALRPRCARLIVAVHPRLLRLLSGNADGIELIALNAAPPDFDYHIPLASLPLALGTTMQTIPFAMGYLSAEPDRVEQWAQRLGGHGFRIGVAWEGNMAIPGAEGKSFRIAHLQALSQRADVRLISLQKNSGAEQMQALPAGMTVESFAMDEGEDAFLDTAAIMRNCDLVIAADTGAAHLAGALGVPCWVGLKFIPEWRWFLGRADSPWYKSVRLFRQRAPGDWDSVFVAMDAQLQAVAAV